jgi:hypothetical protein
MNTENLHDLIANLYDSERIADIEKDIRIGDEIIASADKLVPNAEVIGDIKGAISKRLTAGRRRRRNTISLRTAAAAIIVVVAFMGIRNIVHQGVSPLPPSVARDFFWGEDATASNIAYELDEIDNDIISIRLGECETELKDIAVTLEQEIMQTSGGLWR